MSKVVLSALLSTVYKLDNEEIAELLNKSDDIPETSKNDKVLTDKLLELDTVRVTAFNERSKKRFDDGHKKGTSESLSKLEQDIRDEFAVDDAALKGIDLIKHVAASALEKAGTAGKGKAGELTDDQIKKSTLYLQLETKLKARELELIAEKETAVKEVEGKYKATETKGTIKGAALKLLDEMNPILSTDTAKAARQKELFINEVLSGKYELAQDGKTILLLDDDGKPRQDAHGHTLVFDDHVKALATGTFDFAASAQRESPANGGKTNPQQQQQNNQTKVLPVPKSLDELAKVLEDSQYTLAERTQIHSTYETAQAGAGK